MLFPFFKVFMEKLILASFTRPGIFLKKGLRPIFL